MTLAFDPGLEIIAAEDRGMTPHNARQLLRQIKHRAKLPESADSYIELSQEGVEALQLAIQLLTKRIYERQMGRKGARIRRRKYSKADYRRWGKLGGRPKKT